MVYCVYKQENQQIEEEFVLYKQTDKQMAMDLADLMMALSDVFVPMSQKIGGEDFRKEFEKKREEFKKSRDEMEHEFHKHGCHCHHHHGLDDAIDKCVAKCKEKPVVTGGEIASMVLRFNDAADADERIHLTPEVEKELAERYKMALQLSKIRILHHVIQKYAEEQKSKKNDTGFRVRNILTDVPLEKAVSAMALHNMAATPIANVDSDLIGKVFLSEDGKFVMETKNDGEVSVVPVNMFDFHKKYAGSRWNIVEVID